MSSNEESEIKNQESEIQNTNQDSITVNTTESKEVNEKIIELPYSTKLSLPTPSTNINHQIEPSQGF